MLINLSEIMSVNGKTEHMEVPVELENFKLDGVIYEFCAKEPLDLDITNLGKRKVVIKGSTSISLYIPCSRCLTDVVTVFDISFSKEIDFNDTEEKRIEDLNEMSYISGYNLDVDLLVYSEIFIDFPMKVLCSDNCKGICNVCGMNLNKGTCDCESTSLDPRMSVIQDIFKNFKEV